MVLSVVVGVGTESVSLTEVVKVSDTVTVSEAVADEGVSEMVSDVAVSWKKKRGRVSPRIPS